jgi:hypothetical protein
MAVVIVLANPSVYEVPRNEMLAIQQFKAGELRQGYTHDDPYFYQKSPQFWAWTIHTWFGSTVFIGFLITSYWRGFLSRKNLMRIFIWNLVIAFSFISSVFRRSQTITTSYRR